MAAPTSPTRAPGVPAMPSHYAFVGDFHQAPRLMFGSHVELRLVSPVAVPMTVMSMLTMSPVWALPGTPWHTW
jgi:hypothetical protein